MSEAGLAPIIAIVGSDGSGKSTVGDALLAWLRESRPAALCHLGKQTGNAGRRIARWPLLGRPLNRAIQNRSRTIDREKGPGPFTALALFAISTRRVRRFRRMMDVRRQGITVLADRYPQTAVPGPMDGPQMAGKPWKSPFGRLLARREAALYDWMAGYVPDLVIRLNVDLETAAARKPDHRYSSLAAKVADVPRLSFNGAPIVDIDSTRPLNEVLTIAKAAVTEALQRR